MLLLLKGAFLAATSAGLAAGLAWSAAERSGPWPVTAALLLGPDDDRDEVDLRFRAFVAGALVIVVAALAFPDAVRGAGIGRLALALAMVLPLATLLLAAAADLGARLVAAQRASATIEVAGATIEAAVAGAGAPGAADDDDPEARASLEDLLEEARLELREASTRVTRGHLQTALEALREVLDEYAVAGEDDPALRARVRGVTALARTCAEAESQDALQLLGVRPDADPQEIASVCRALLPLYRGPAALPGVDPGRADALEAAAAQLARRAA